MTAFPPFVPEPLCRDTRYCWRIAIIAGFVVFVLVLIILAAVTGS